MSLAGALHRYAAHDDPAAAAANFLALVLAWNGPFYPVYVIGLVGWDGIASLWSVFASPLFFAVPWVMRHDTRTGRAMLPLIGTANTLWCTKLLGPGTEVGLFLLPCIALAALLYRRSERRLMLVMLLLPLALLMLPDAVFGVPIVTLPPDRIARLAALDIVSVALLTGLVTWQFAGVLGRLERGGV